MKQHLQEFDFMRCVAALAVIAIHVTSGHTKFSKFAFVWNTAMIFAVPLFIILSGFLLHYSNKDKAELNYIHFIKKRFSKVFIPYLIWTVIYMIHSHEGNMGEILSLGFVVDFLRNIILGKGFVHLYFIVFILQLYLLYPFLKNMMYRNTKAMLGVTFMISFYFQMADYARQHGVLLLPAFGVKYYPILFTKWIFYFTFGMYAATRLDSLRRLVSTHKVEIGIVWILTSTVLIISSRALKTQVSGLSPVIILYCMVCFMFFYTLAFMLQDKLSKIAVFIEWFSRQSFIMYFSHLLLIRSILFKANTIVGFNIWKDDKGMLLLFVATVALTAGFAHIVSLTALAPYLGGVQEKGKIRSKQASASM